MQIEQLAYLAVQSISDVVSFSLWKWKHPKKKKKPEVGKWFHEHKLKKVMNLKRERRFLKPRALRVQTSLKIAWIRSWNVNEIIINK